MSEMLEKPRRTLIGFSILVALAGPMLNGCLVPPTTTVTTALAKSPAITYDAIIVRPLIDSTNANPSPRITKRLMAETITRLMRTKTFRFWHVVDTSVFTQTAFFPLKRGLLLPLDTLLNRSRNVLELEMVLYELDKGNSAVRQLLDYLDGGGAVSVRTKLIDRKNGHVIVAGQTRRTIRGAHATEHSTVRPLARAVTLFVSESVRELAGYSNQRQAPKRLGIQSQR